MDWIDLVVDRDQWRVLVNTEVSVSIKCWEILEQLSDRQLLNDPVPRYLGLIKLLRTFFYSLYADQ
jgi:hypothetical protein